MNKSPFTPEAIASRLKGASTESKIVIGDKVRLRHDPRWTGEVKKIYAGPIADVRWQDGAFRFAREFIFCSELEKV